MPYFVKCYRAFFYDFNASFMLLQSKKPGNKETHFPDWGSGLQKYRMFKIERSINQLLKYCLS